MIDQLDPIAELQVFLPALQNPQALFGVILITGLLLGLALARLLPIRSLRRQVSDLRSSAHALELKLAQAGNNAALVEELGQSNEDLRAELLSQQGTNTALRARLETEQKNHAIRLEELREAQARLEAQFAKLAQEALHKNADSFLKLMSERFDKHRADAGADLTARHKAIEALVQPIRDNLQKVETQISAVEKAREGAYHQIRQQISHMAEGHAQLQKETGNLVQALRAPKTRGRWGEFQLQQVFEMADMQEHVHFDLEVPLPDATRPDAMVNLPGGKCIIVDAKTPLEAYLNAIETQNQIEQKGFLKAHAQQLRSHVQNLSSKAYWNALPHTPDFVVMFVPGEAFYAAAFEEDPNLMDYAVRNKVLIASPTTLIALLKAVGYGWQQEKLAENAVRIGATARELYDRIKTYASHMQTMGKNLDKAVESYNKSVGSMERSVLPSARRLESLGATPADADIPELQPLEKDTRPISAPELLSKE